MRKTRSDFDGQDDWLAHILSQRPVPERAYALASGRMELFRSFYRMQGLPFPIPVAQEYERIEMLQDPERTAALEALNGEVLRNLTVHLFNQAQSNAPESDSRTLPSPREQIQELRNHLAQQNPYFGLWVVFERRQDVEERRAGYSVAADPNTGGLSDPLLGELVERLVGESARPADDADRTTGQRYLPGGDADVALAG